MKLSSENQRMWDLVRRSRGSLHVEGYITDAELELLASDGAAVKRLEDYDKLKAELLDYRAYYDAAKDTIEEQKAGIAIIEADRTHWINYWRGEHDRRVAELTEAKALVAGAYLAAAEHCKFTLEEILDSLKYAGEGTTAYVKPDLLGNDLNRSLVRKLQHISDTADAERSLQVYAQERVVEALTAFKKGHDLGWVPPLGGFSGYHNYADVGSAYSERMLDEMIAAATARLAELRR